MDSSKIEKLIATMSPEASKIYFDAKQILENSEDSDSEEFIAAARIVRAFWKTAKSKRD
jgi:hypothetical protein